MTEQPEEKMITRVSQEEAQYTPLSNKKGQACANCRWFNAQDNMCLIVENYPEDILPTGLSNRWEAKPTPEEPTVTIEAESVTVVVEPEMMGMMELKEETIEPVEPVLETGKAGATLSRSNADIVKAARRFLKELLVKAGIADDDESEKSVNELGSDFTVLKGVDGKYYWFARHTNNFEDTQKEILSRKSHEAYIARLNLGLVDMPTLRCWHVKDTDHGKADIVFEHAGFMFAIGHFDDTPEGQRAAKAYVKAKGKVELSHGFYYPKWALKDGVYHSYNTFEISTLPPGSAANPYTSFEEIEVMALTEKQRQWIKDKLGDAAVQRVDQKMNEAEKDSEVLKAIDVKYKDFADIPDAEEAAKDLGEKPDFAIMAKMVLAVIESQAGLVESQQKSADESGTTIKAMTERLDALEIENKGLRERLSMTPRASQADKTVSNDETLKEQIEEKASELDDFWAAAGLKVTKDKANGK